MSMSKQDLWIPAMMALSLLLPAHSFAAAAAEGNPGATVIAVVNGKDLTQADFISFVNTRVGEQGRQVNLNQQQMNMLFSEYINRELVYQDAVSKGWDRAPEVASAVDNHRRNIIARYAFSQLLNTPISDEELEKAYKKLKPVREFKAKHILVGSEPEAQQVITALDGGKSFEELAKTTSIDATAEQGGEIGWVSAEQMTPPLRDAVVSIKKGSYNRQPIRTEFGWHVLRVDDTRIIPTPPYEEVKDDLRRQMYNESIAQYIDELRKAGKVEVK